MRYENTSDIELTPAGTTFVTERHLAVLSTLQPDGSIHSVPVGFTYENGVLRVITSGDTRKVANVRRAGHATIAQVDGAAWMSFSGPAVILDDPTSVKRAVDAYAGRYRVPRENPLRVVIELSARDVLSSSGLLALGPTLTGNE